MYPDMYHITSNDQYRALMSIQIAWWEFVTNVSHTNLCAGGEEGMKNYTVYRVCEISLFLPLGSSSGITQPGSRFKIQKWFIWL